MCLALCLVRKLINRWATFSSAAIPTHATAMAIHFPANAGLIDLTDKRLMTGIWLILDQFWVLFLATKIPAHLAPFSKGRMNNQSPLGASWKKTGIPRQTFHIYILASRCGWPHSGHWLFEKIQNHCCSRNQPNTVCLHCSNLACPTFAFSGPARPLMFV